MSVFVLGKASLGVGIVPDWAFWTIVWWAGWFAILLFWYENTKKERMKPLVCFFLFVFSGLMPFFGIIFAIVKLVRGEK